MPIQRSRRQNHPSWQYDERWLEDARGYERGEIMLNRITRKIPVSRYKVKYTEDGTEREIVFETLSGLKQSEAISYAQTYINMYTDPGEKIFVSPNIEETPQGVHLYESTLVEFLEIATPVKAKNKED